MLSFDNMATKIIVGAPNCALFGVRRSSCWG